MSEELINLRFNDILLKDETEKNWEVFGNVSIVTENGEKCAYFDSGSYLKTEELRLSGKSVTYEFWLKILSGFFGISTWEGYRNDAVGLCIGRNSTGYYTGITSYYPGYEIIAGEQGTNLISENEWHYIGFTIENNITHYISVDGNILYTGKNTRGYRLDYLPVQIGSVPTWSWNRGNRFNFRGYLREFRITEKAKYKNAYIINDYPYIPEESTEFTYTVEIPNDKTGSYMAENRITYYYKVAYIKESFNTVRYTLKYGIQKKSYTEEFFTDVIHFSEENYMNSYSTLLSLINGKINELKEYLDTLIGPVEEKDTDIIKYESFMKTVYYIRNTYKVTKLTPVEGSIRMITEYAKHPLFTDKKEYSERVLEIRNENYSRYLIELDTMAEEENTKCELYLDTLIGEIRVPDSEYKSIKLKNGDTYYIKIVYMLKEKTDYTAYVSYRVTWDRTLEYRNEYSYNEYLINSENYINHENRLKRLGYEELERCKGKFEGVSGVKIWMRRKGEKITYVTYEEKEEGKTVMAAKTGGEVNYLKGDKEGVGLMVKSSNERTGIKELVSLERNE